MTRENPGENSKTLKVNQSFRHFHGGEMQHNHFGQPCLRKGA